MSSDKPDVAFTLEQLEQEVSGGVEPLRMGVGGKVIVLPSLMQMEADALVDVLEALEASETMAAMGQAGMVMKLLPKMIGQDNFDILREAGISLGALVKVFDKVEAYYADAVEAAGVEDPKGSSSS